MVYGDNMIPEYNIGIYKLADDDDSDDEDDDSDMDDEDEDDEEDWS